MLPGDGSIGYIKRNKVKGNARYSSGCRSIVCTINLFSYISGQFVGHIRANELDIADQIDDRWTIPSGSYMIVVQSCHCC